MKRLALLLRRKIVYCMVLSLVVGVGYAESKADELTVIAQALEQAEDLPNPANRNVALSWVAATFLQKGSVKGALTTAGKISEPYAKSLLLVELARLSAEQGSSTLQSGGLVGEAVPLIDQIDDPDQRLFVLLKAAEVSNAFGLENMIPVLNRTCGNVLDSASVKDPQLRAARMAALAGQDFDCGSGGGALALLEDALDIATEKMEDAYEIAPKQEDANINITVLDHIALGYLQLNEPGKALDVIKNIEDRYTRLAAADRMVSHGPAWQLYLEKKLREAGNRDTDNSLLERLLLDVKEAKETLARTEDDKVVYQMRAEQVDLDADDSLRKKKNVIKRGVADEMKAEMDEIFKVLNKAPMSAMGSTPKGKKEQFLTYLENIRYGKHQQLYFKVFDSQGKLLEEPYLPELEGKNLSNLRDANGNELFTLLQATDQREDGQGFVSYMWPGNGWKNKSIATLFLVRSFEPWGWYVVTGAQVPTIDDHELYENANLVEDRSAASPM